MILLYRERPQLVLLDKPMDVTVFCPEMGKQVVFELKAGVYDLYLIGSNVVCRKTSERAK